MSQWPAAKARRVLAALLRLGWTLKRSESSHKTLARPGWPDVVFAFHDGEELGPRMLARIAKRTGLTPEDLQGGPLTVRANESLQPTRRGEHRVAPGPAAPHNRVPLARSAPGRAAELGR